MRPPLHRLPVPLLTPRRARGAQRSCRRPWEAPAGGVLGTGRTPGFWASPRLLWTCCPPASHPWVPLGPGNPGGALQVLAGGGPAAPAEKALAPSPRALPTASRPRPRPRGRTSRAPPTLFPCSPEGSGGPAPVRASEPRGARGPGPDPGTRGWAATACLAAGPSRDPDPSPCFRPRPLSSGSGNSSARGSCARGGDGSRGAGRPQAGQGLARPPRPHCVPRGRVRRPEVPAPGSGAFRGSELFARWGH